MQVAGHPRSWGSSTRPAFVASWAARSPRTQSTRWTCRYSRPGPSRANLVYVSRAASNMNHGHKKVRLELTRQASLCWTRVITICAIGAPGQIGDAKQGVVAGIVAQTLVAELAARLVAESIVAAGLKESVGRDVGCKVASAIGDERVCHCRSN